MIHHVIWDFDGTLFDTYPLMTRAFHAALAEMRCPDLPSPGQVLARMKISMGEAFDAFVTGRGLSVEAFTAVYRPLRLRLEAEEARPFPGIRELCADIRAAGGENYIFTHRSRSALPMLENQGMTAYFAEIVTMDDGFPRKPAPDAIDHLVECHGLARADTIMIGDRELDVRSGRNAGVHTCLIADPAPAETCAERVVADVAGLYEVIGIGGEKERQAEI